MELLKGNLLKFILDYLPDKLKSVKSEFIKNDKITWDEMARKSFHKYVTKWIQEYFEITLETVKDVFYVEKLNTIPESSRKIKFFGSSTNPDAAFIQDNFSIAIELDHGKDGSRIKNALAKGSFNSKLGFDYVVIFFFNDSSSQMETSEKDSELLKEFKEKNSTELRIIQ